ncbi:MAG TPA: xanthine dehydrogenase family protein molybdopterin-binding subunit [Rhodoblastus sp.]|nr:xanthine dehydrogenase family protein molybdopterin-binding subunit [Rhodoblastus sp.]
MDVLPANLKFGAHQSVTRLEDERLLTGAGRYIDDRAEAGALWMVLLRSPRAHATVVAIDTSAAKAASGIVAVYTGADLVADGVGALPAPPPLFKRPDGADMNVPPRRILADETVRFVGEPLVAVIAETREAAYDAVELIAVDYEDLPAVTDVRAATQPGAPRVWPATSDNFVAAHSYGDKAKVDDIFATAAHTVALEIMNQRLIPFALEPRGALAAVHAETGRLILRTQSQTPTTTRDILADAVLKRPKESIQVLVGDIGGGFGQKTNLYPEEALVSYAATKLGKPVRWRADRIEEFLGGTHGRDLWTKAELALDAEGRILAFRAQSLGNTGATPMGVGVLIPLVLSPFVSVGVYHIPALRFDISAVMTNTAPIGAYRGAGRPEAIYIIERLMDSAARQLKMDPRDIRKINAIRPDTFPYTTPVGQVYDSGAFADLLDKASAAADWDGFAERRKAAEAKGLLYGRGLASYIEWTGGNTLQETVSVHATADGEIIVHSATQAMGQGFETSYSQMIAAALEVSISKVRIVQGDTDLAQGMGSVGSRSLFIGGSAVAVGAADLLEKAREKAAEHLESAPGDLEYAGGRFTIAGTDRSIALADLARGEFEERLSVRSTAKVDGPSWPNGAHIAEVSIDPDTGVLTIERYATLDDVGVAVNPMLVQGQIHGGIAQGVGQALYEGAVYEDGQLLTSSLMDYKVARADDMPSFKVALFDGAPCRTNPLGAKGCGESGTVAGTPTLVNAVMDALSSRGAGEIDMPITPEKIWRACNP